MSRTKRTSRAFNRYRGPTDKGTHKDQMDGQPDERGPTSKDRKYRERQYRHQTKIQLKTGDYMLKNMPTDPIKDWI